MPIHSKTKVHFKNALFSIVLLLLTNTHFLFGQDDVYRNGVGYFEDENYVNAIISFTNALEHKYTLAGKFVPLAHSYRAKSIVHLYEQSFAKNDTAFIRSWPGMLLTARGDLREIHKYNDGKLDKLIEQTELHLIDALEKYGSYIGKRIRTADFEGDANEKWLALVNQHVLLLDSLKPKQYPVKDLLGLFAFKLGEGFKALEFFKVSNQLYRVNTPMIPDLSHLYTRYLTALIQYQNLINIEESITLLKSTERSIVLNHANFSQADQPIALDLEEKIETLEFQLKLLGDQ